VTDHHPGDEIDRRYAHAIRQAEHFTRHAELVATALAQCADDLERLASDVLHSNPVDPDGPVQPSLAAPDELRHAAAQVRAAARAALSHSGGWGMLAADLTSRRVWNACVPEELR
jgi:hypothetical protein